MKHLKKLSLIPLLTIFLLHGQLHAEAPAPLPVPIKLTIRDHIQVAAVKYNVSFEEMVATMKCESGLNPNAVNHTAREYSVGISQINLKAHPDVSVAQAKDPHFAAEFMAKEFARNNKKIWSCYRKIYKV
jgi:hypothetical protein